MKIIKDLDGSDLMLYNGTNRKFEEHSSKKHRTLLNEDYQGDWFCFTPNQDVAWKYADAARNQNLDKDFFLADIENVFSKYDKEVCVMMTDLALSIMDNGFENGMNEAIKKFAKRNNINDEDKEMFFFRKLTAAEEELGVNVNDFCDALDYVEYSKSGRSDSLQEVFNILNSNISELPFTLLEDLKSWGFEKSMPEPKIFEVKIKANNVLETKSKKEAREAKKNGFDLVIYSGEGIVDGVPEYLVANKDQIIKQSMTIRNEIREEIYEDEDDFYPSTVITQTFDKIDYKKEKKQTRKNKIK